MSWCAAWLRRLLVLMVLGFTGSAYAVTIDPVITPTNATSQVISGTVGPGEVVLAITVNTGEPAAVTFSGSTWSYLAAGLAERENTVTVAAFDADANPTSQASAAIFVDTVPPAVEAARFVDSTHVEITFSEAVAGAELAGSYRIEGLSVTGATRSMPLAYLITTSLQSIGGTYTVACPGIRDAAGNSVQGTESATFTRTRESDHSPSVPSPVAPAEGGPNLNEVDTLTPTLSVNASSDQDGDPVSHTFQISDDRDFSRIVASSAGTAADGGTASWTVAPSLAENTTYFWRALATDGYASSNYSPVASFFLSTANLAPAGCAVSAPADQTGVATLTPVLSLSNATDANHDTIVYDFEIGADPGFSRVIAAATVAENPSGITSWGAPGLDDNTLYFWRGRSRDQHGAEGSWTSASFFVNTANDAPTAPTLNAPESGTYNDREVTTVTPTLSVHNASDPDRDSLTYVFEIDTVPSFNGAPKQVSAPLQEGSGTTEWTPAPLADNTLWYWRARAGDGTAEGPWMATGTFFVNAANDAPATPTVENPADGSRVASLSPTLSVNPANDADHDAVTYEFAVYGDSSLTTAVAAATGQTVSWRVDPPLEIRTYYWTARARDSHGGAGPWMPAQRFFADTNGIDDAPAVTITAPGSAQLPLNAAADPGYPIQWSASDPDSNPAITLYYDRNGSGYAGTQIAPAILMNAARSYTWDTSALADGTYYLYARIADDSSTVYSAYAGPLVIDRTPPAPPQVAGPRTTNATRPTWSWIPGGGGNGTFRYRLDSSELSLATETSATSYTPEAALAEGSHTLYLQERDDAGNWSAAESFTITVDITLPRITAATSTTAAGWYRAGSVINVTLKFSEPVSTDGLVVALSSGGSVSTGALSDATSCSAGYTVAAGENSRELAVTSTAGVVTDAAGNTAANPSVPSGKNIADGKSIVIDTTAPTVSAGTSQTRNGAFTQSGIVSDANPVTYRWSGEAGPGAVSFGSPASPSTTISADADGVYLIRLTATDAAGNAAFSEITLTWDATAPSVSAGPNRTTNGAFTQAGSATDATPLTFGWTKESGPGTLSFGSSSAASTLISAGADGTYLIRLTATDAAGNSAHSEMTLTWDTTSPTVSAGANSIRSAPFTQTGSASDATPLTFRWSQEGGPGTLSLGSPTDPATTISAEVDGNYQIRLTATDAAGNSSFSDAVVVWDTTPPTVSAGADRVRNTAFTQPGTASDATALTYRWTQQSGLGSVTFGNPAAAATGMSANADGRYLLRLTATDAAGNSAFSEMTLIWDTTPPTVSAGPNTFRNGSFTQTGTASDATAVTYQWSQLEGPGTVSFGNTASAATTMTADADGSYLIRLTATDAAGNSAYGEMTLTWDTIRPTVSAGADRTGNGTFTLMGSSSDVTPVTYRWSKESGPGAVSFGTPAASSTTVGADTDGSYLIRLTATDAAGNSAYSEMTLTWDTTPPTVAAGANQTRNGAFIQSGTASDATPITYRWSKEAGPGTVGFGSPAVSSTTISADTDGSYLIRLTATDAAGNSASSDFTLVWDTATPAVSAGPDATRNGEFLQGGSASDATALALAWSQVSGPGTVSFGSPATASTTMKATADGSYRLRLTATDAAGNAASSEMTLTWDTTAPAVSAGANRFANGVFTQQGAVTDATALSYRWSRESGPGTVSFGSPTASSTTISADTDGSYLIRLTATDAAGNSASSEMTLTWDTTGPVVFAGPDRTTNAIFTQEGSVSDANPVTYRWSTEGGPGALELGTPGEPSTTVNAAADGTYRIRLTATDAAGNSAYAEATVVWDTVPPGVATEARFVDSTHVELTFSEPVRGAELPENYRADQGLGINGATQSSATAYLLTTTLQRAGTTYAVTCGTAIGDTAGNPVGTANSATFVRTVDSDHAPAVPTLDAPAEGGPNRNEVATLTPTLSVNASFDRDGDPVGYAFEVSDTSDFSRITASVAGVTAVGETASWTVTPSLAENTTYFWRALADDGYARSSYLQTASFFVSTTNLAPAGNVVSAPADGTEVTTRSPVLALSNATDPNRDTLGYEVELATDAGFSAIVVAAAVAESQSGVTSWTAPQLNDNTLYFWRGRARDQHGLAGEWTSASFFVNTANDAPSAPTLNAPLSGRYNDNEVTTLTPTLVVNNATDPDRAPLTYLFEIDTVPSFNGTEKQVSPVLPEGSGTTGWTTGPLADNTVWYWRAKASDGAADAPWMATGTFFVNTANNAPSTPTLENPADGSRLASLSPTLSVNPATDIDHDPVSYEFAVYNDSSLSSASQVAGATGQGTSWTVDPPVDDVRIYYWTARAKDSHNYFSPWMPVHRFFVDSNGINNPPAIEITQPAGPQPPLNGSTPATVPISWKASDPDSNPVITLYYDRNSSGYAGTEIAGGITMNGARSYSWDTASLPDGAYYLYARIVDEDSTVHSGYAGPIVIDRTPPAAPQVSAPAATGEVNPTWNWSSGGGGNGTFRYRLDSPDLASGGTETAATSCTPEIPLSPGPHTLYIQERDAAGNWSAAGVATVTIDTTPPWITGASSTSASGSYRGGSALNITLGFSEPVSSDGLVIDLNTGGALATGPLSGVTTYSGSYQVTPGENAAALAVTAVRGFITDAAGNATGASVPEGKNLTAARTLIVDTTPPAVGAGAGGVRNAAFTQTATASDSYPMTFAWSKKSGPGDVLFAAPSALATALSATLDGTYLLSFTATDQAGNSASSEVTLVWDTVPPAVVSAGSGTGAGFYPAGSEISVTVAFSEPISSPGLTISLTSGGSVPIGPAENVSTVSGTYRPIEGENAAPLNVAAISGTITDAASNSAANPAVPAGKNISDAVTIVIDTAAPDTFLADSPADPTNRTSGSIGFRSSDGNATFECSLDGAAFTACASPYPFDLSGLEDASHRFAVRARNRAGTADPSPATCSWTVNTKPPVAAVSAVPPITNSPTQPFTVGGGVVAYRFSIDAGGYSTETAATNPIRLTGLGEGSHTLSVIGKDDAGNWQPEAAATSVEWTVDLTSPVFEEVSALPDGSFTNQNDMNIAGTVTDAHGIAGVSVEVGTPEGLFADPVAVDPSGAFSYLLQQRLVPGQNVVRLTATDQAGNRATDSRSITYDPAAPQLAIALPADNSTTGTALAAVSGTVDENIESVVVKSYDCGQVPSLTSSDPAAVDGTSFSATATLKEGCNTLVITVTDLAGNQVSDKRTVVFDDVRPALAVTEPPADLRTQATIMTVQGTVDDPLSSVRVTVSDGSSTFSPPVVAGAFQQQVTFSETRVYHLTVTATDAGGNQTAVQRNVVYARPARGDINNDGRVDLADALVALQIASGLLTLNDSELLHGDVAPLVNGVPQSDGVIDVGDAVVILKAVVGLINLK